VQGATTRKMEGDTGVVRFFAVGRTHEEPGHSEVKREPQMRLQPDEEVLAMATGLPELRTGEQPFEPVHVDVFETTRIAHFGLHYIGAAGVAVQITAKDFDIG
jgi:hypothetical protein